MTAVDLITGEHIHGTAAEECAYILRSWAKAYRDGPAEHRFPSDPHAEFFPGDLDRAAFQMERQADEIEKLRKAVKPFAALADIAARTPGDCVFGTWNVSYSDLIRAAAAYESAAVKRKAGR